MLEVGRGLSAIAAVGLLAGCTVLFDPGPSSSAARAPAQRVYPLGSNIGGTLYEHLDFGQGTVTFWVALEEPLGDVAEAVPLLDLAGVAIALEPGGDLSASIAGGPSEVLFENAAADWQPEEDHFLALRWDARLPVSGGAGLETHVALTVDGEHFYRFPQAFEAAPAGDELAVGDPGERARVEQVVVYRRPLFVPDDVNLDDALTRMAEDGKRGGPAVEGGPWDVLFATAAPRDPEDGTARAWRHALRDSSLHPAGLFLSDTLEEGWDPSLGSAPEEESVFGGGVVFAESESSSRLLDVQPGASYILSALAHAQGAGEPGLKIIALDGDDAESLLRNLARSAGSRRAPLRISTTFEAPSDARRIRVEIRNASSAGTTYFHSIDLRRNLLENPSFEQDLDPRPDPFEPPAWTLQGIGEGQSIRQAVSPVQSGGACVCLSSAGGDSPHVLRQAPELEDHHYYAVGAHFYWSRPASDIADPGLPDVGVSNGSLFEVGRPYPSGDKVGASGRAIPAAWQHVGAAGRRLMDDGYNAHNDNVLFGNRTRNGNTDVCLDDAYAVELAEVTGEAGERR